MELIRVGRWEVEVDAAETARVQAARDSGSPESCGCLHCRNCVAARHLAYPPEAIRLLKSLGVPENRESELYHCGEVEPGVHFYGGWFHFVGRIASGPGCFRAVRAGAQLSSKRSPIAFRSGLVEGPRWFRARFRPTAWGSSSFQPMCRGF